MNIFGAKKQLNVEGLRHSTPSVLFSTLAINFLSLALPIMTLQVYDRVLPNHSVQTLEILVVGVCFVVILEVLLKLCRSYIVGWTGASFEHRISNDMMEHILRADLKYLRKEGTGADLQHLSSVSKLKDFYNGEISSIWLDSFFVVIFLGLIAYIGGPLVLVPLGVLALFGIITFHVGKNLKDGLTQRNECDERRYNFLLQALLGVHTIKSSGLEQLFCRRYEYMEQESSLVNLEVARVSTSAFNAASVFSHLMLVLVISMGALLVMDMQMSVGGLVACILLSGRIMQPIQKLLQVWMKSQDFNVTQENVLNVMNTPLMKQPEKSAPIFKKGHLLIKNVSFRYEGQEDYLLKNIFLTLKAGQSVFIGGRDGSGKSTLLKLIAGVYNLERGDIFVDDHHIEDIAPSVLSKNVAYISDHNAIFRGTIRDNLTCFGEIPNQEAMEIIEEMGIAEDISRLPAGFDTVIEDTSSDNVSPSLKQRILIARTLAARPRIILIDNADHALDRASYTLFYNLLLKWKERVILVIVSEDQAMMKLADRSYVMHGGSLIEQKVETNENTEVQI